jgi:hypothetical protein
MLIDGADLAFERAKLGLEQYQLNKLEYGSPLSNDIPLWKRTERNDNEASNVVRAVLAKYPGVNGGDLSTLHKDVTSELGITVFLASFDELITKDDEFMRERDTWYANSTTALNMANDYKNLFTNGADKIKNQRIPTQPGQEKIKVGGVQGGQIIFQVFKINPSTAKDEILRETKRPIEDVPPGVLKLLAAVIWGGENLADLYIREAAFFIYSARHDALDIAAEDIQNAVELTEFFNGELAEMEPLMVAVILERKKSEIAALVRQAEALKGPQRDAKLKDIRHVYEEVVRKYGDTPAFDAVSPEIREIIPGPGGGSIPAGGN